MSNEITAPITIVHNTISTTGEGGATITIGQVLTGEPGAPGSVVNVGTPVNAIFDFVLPVAATQSASISAPTGLAATAGDGEISISWNSVSGAVSYRVLSNNVSVTVVSATNYTLSGLTNGQEYSITVTAIDGDDVESSPTNPILRTPDLPSTLTFGGSDLTFQGETLTFTPSS